jgi:hypothetical protein
MTSNRTPIRRKAHAHISPEVIAAWRRCDFLALHRLLGLKPWEATPLPYAVCRLGVDQDDTPENRVDWDPTMPKAIALQRQLLELAGWPDCRAEYERQLQEAEQHVADCRDRVLCPPNTRGEYGARTNAAECREALEDALAEAKYRRELLEGLEAVRAKWTPGTTPTP